MVRNQPIERVELLLPGNLPRLCESETGPREFFFGCTFDLVSERESLLSRNLMPTHGGPSGPVGRCMGLYSDVLGSNLGVGNFFSEKNLALGFRGFGSRV